MKRIFGIIRATLTFGVLIVTSAGPASAQGPNVLHEALHSPPSAPIESTGGGYADALSRLQEQQGAA
jgi:hypothetical protein